MTKQNVWCICKIGGKVIKDWSKVGNGQIKEAAKKRGQSAEEF